MSSNVSLYHSGIQSYLSRVIHENQPVEGCAAYPNQRYNYYRDRPMYPYVHVGNNYTVYSSSSHSNRVRDKNDENKESVLLGAIILMISSAFLGLFFSKRNSLKEHINESKEMKDHVVTSLNMVNQYSLAAGLKDVSLSQLKLEKNEISKINNYLKGIGSVAAGSGGYVVGGLSATPWLIPAGTAAIIAGIAFSIFNAALHWDDESKYAMLRSDTLRKAQNLLNQLSTAC